MMITVKHPLKQTIAHCFNQAVASYDAHCYLQQSVGKQLLQQLKPFATNTACIVDLGCGTGLITKILVDSYPYTDAYAIDIAEKLLAVSIDTLRQTNVKVMLADFEQKNFADNSIHLAFSNMALQWSIHLEQTFAVIYQQLASQGILAFSLPIAGTFRELCNVSKHNFYSAQQVIELLTQSGFQLLLHRNDVIVDEFSSPLMALRSLKAVGAHGTVNKLNKSGDGLRGKNFLTTCFRKNHYQLSYVIGYFVVLKPAHVT